MKKRFCFAALLGSALLGMAYTLDLFLNTNADTGFLVHGAAFWRYLLMVPAVALCFLSGLYVPKKQPCGLSAARGAQRPETWLYLPAAAAATVYGVQQLISIAMGRTSLVSMHHAADSPMRTGVFRIIDFVSALLFLVLALWCMMRFFACRTGEPGAPWSRYLGVSGCAAFYLHTIVAFIVQPSSLHRVAPAVTILASLAALLFVTALLRAIYLPEGEGFPTAPVLARTGLLAFLFGTCLALPQMIWQCLSGAPSIAAISLTILEASLGVLGACLAWRIAKRPPRAAAN